MENEGPVEPAITVSVVMATYNRENYIREALDSIFNQTRPPDEVIVVDDGSTDSTPQIIQEYGDKIHYIRQANKGRPAALNVGVPEASSSHIWIFDDDDAALPTAIEASINALETHSEADFSYSYKLFYDGDGDIWDRSRWRKHPIQTSNPDRLFVEWMQLCTCQLQGMLIPKRCYEVVGPFDEKLLRTQDYDLQLRIARRFRGVEIGCFMFVLRNHSGDRGPGFERHSHDDRVRHWVRYDKMTFSRLREELALHEYLPGISSEVLSDEDKGAALLTRADIMYRHGLHEEGSQDLNQAVLAGVPDEDVDALIRRVTNLHEPEYIPGLPHIAGVLSRMRWHEQSARWNKSALRGLYWTLQRMLKNRQWKASATLSHAMLLLGVGEMRGKQQGPLKKQPT